VFSSIQVCARVCWFTYIHCRKVAHFSESEWRWPFLNRLKNGISLNLSIDVKVLLQLNYQQLILKMNFRLPLCVHWSTVINMYYCGGKRLPWAFKSRAHSCLRTFGRLKFIRMCLYVFGFSN